MKCKDCGNTHAALPGFPNHVFCDYYHLHMSNIADASRCEHFKPKVKTNADRIRSMSDEELANFLDRVEMGDIDYSKTFCDLCDGFYDCHDDCLLGWLRAEATI